MPHTPQWFEYDWPIDGRPARFVVDLALSGAPRAGRPVLLYVSCESKRAKADALSGFESARAEALCKKLCKKLAPYYAGFIETGAQRQYYFYVKERAMLEEAESLANKEHLLLCRVGCTEEPSWATFHKLLYPDAAKLQTEENRKRIELMLEHGDSPAVARRISLFLFFPTEATMLLFSEQARLSGYAVGDPVFTPDQPLAYGVSVVRIATLRKPEIDALTTRAIRIAERYNGELRYWEAPVARRGGPLM